MGKRKLVFVILLVLLVTPIGLFGDSLGVTDWAISSGGTVSWDGGSSPLVGTNLPVAFVVGIGTPLNSGIPLAITGGILDFTSGSYSGAGWSWGPGGSLDITGCIGLTCGTLLTDGFQSVNVQSIAGTPFQVQLGNIEGTINPNLADYLGLEGNTAFTASSITLTLLDLPPGPGGIFSDLSLGGTINANAVAASEDWNLSYSLVFFGLALAIFDVLTRARVLRVVLWA